MYQLTYSIDHINYQLTILVEKYIKSLILELNRQAVDLERDKERP